MTLYIAKITEWIDGKRMEMFRHPDFVAYSERPIWAYRLEYVQENNVVILVRGRK